jgi:hypothetical protein
MLINVYYYWHRCLLSQPDRTYVRVTSRVTERDHRAAVERPLDA